MTDATNSRNSYAPLSPDERRTDRTLRYDKLRLERTVTYCDDAMYDDAGRLVGQGAAVCCDPSRTPEDSSVETLRQDSLCYDKIRLERVATYCDDAPYDGVGRLVGQGAAVCCDPSRTPEDISVETLRQDPLGYDGVRLSRTATCCDDAPYDDASYDDGGAAVRCDLGRTPGDISVETLRPRTMRYDEIRLERTTPYDDASYDGQSTVVCCDSRATLEPSSTAVLLRDHSSYSDAASVAGSLDSSLTTTVVELACCAATPIRCNLLQGRYDGSETSETDGVDGSRDRADVVVETPRVMSTHYDALTVVRDSPTGGAATDDQMPDAASVRRSVGPTIEPTETLVVRTTTDGRTVSASSSLDSVLTGVTRPGTTLAQSPEGDRDVGRMDRTRRNVRLCTDVVVPAGAEMLVAGQADDAGPTISPAVVLVESLKGAHLPEGMGMARTVASLTETGVIPLRLFNGGERDRRLRAGRLVAVIEQAQVVDDLTRTPTVAALSDAAVTVELPPALEALWHTAQTDPRLTRDGAEALRLLLHRRQAVFAKDETDLGCAHAIVHDIPTITDVPLRQFPRKSSPVKAEAERKMVADMRRIGVIEPSDSRWASPTVLVAKKDGTVRFCVDYRRLNDLTVKDAFPLPRIDETLDSLGGAQWFSTLDLLSGYWQVALTDEAKQKSAFCTNVGTFQWKVMPFGLCNAPATFERLMETVLRGLNWESCLVYLDDVVVFGRTETQLLSRMDVVFQRLAAAGLKLKPAKCRLFLREVEYLGHVISAEGVRVDPRKIDSVRDWGTPTTVTQVRSFLGLASYYRRFVEHFAAIAAPLHAVTGATTQFVWGESQQNAFDELKRRLAAATVLDYPDRETDVILTPDFVGDGIGATLSQRTEQGERVVAYASSVMIPSQRKYCATRKELLALVTFLRHFRPHLYGRRVTVRVDRRALEWLRTLDDPPGLHARWLETLAEYDLVVEHRPRQDHDVDGGVARELCKQCVANKHVAKPEATIRWFGTQVPDVAWPDFTVCQIRMAQLKDSTLRRLAQALEGRGPPPDRALRGWTRTGRTLAQIWPMLELRDGILYLADTPRDAALGLVRLRLLVPIVLQPYYLAAAHWSGGHVDETVVWTRLETSVLWWGMRADVRRMCDSCDECQRTAATARAAGLDYPGATVGVTPGEDIRSAGWPRPPLTTTDDERTNRDATACPLRSSEQLRQAQLSDSDIGWLLLAKETTGRPSADDVRQRRSEARCYAAKWRQLEVRRGVLCVRTWYRSGYSRVRILLPKSFRYPDYCVANRLVGRDASVTDLCRLIGTTEIWWKMESDVRGWSVGRRLD